MRCTYDKKTVVLFTFFILLTCCDYPGNRVDDYEVTGVAIPRISLNGTWKFSIHPQKKFWQKQVGIEEWSNIQVPGECAMQGFPIKYDTAYAYKKEISIPADFADNRIKLRFDGVYSYARVWVNGIYAGDHNGGFTRWECDITKSVKAGEKAWVTVEVTDKEDDISHASEYAKHQIGGILRDVWLIAEPPEHLTHLYVETKFNKNYTDADLIIRAKALLNDSPEAVVKLALYDPQGNIVKLQNDEIVLSKDRLEDTLKIPVPNSQKWDAEHPNLYRLTAQFKVNNKVTYSLSRRVGFREIRVRGNKLLVNGKEIKLRGANRHDMHPVLGRTSTPELDKKDVLLAKEANMNYIRTSHYPPSEAFLKYCDQYGIYVEDETAVCFVRKSQSDRRYTHQYLSQLEEMIRWHRNHPAVIIWSIGNENFYGSNFKLSYDYVKNTDPTRPIMFSFPGLAPDSVRVYDILSSHYPTWQGDLDHRGLVIKDFQSDNIPVVNDEYAHVPCYNIETIREDPNIREFWGQSLDMMWSNVFNADGALGGAIWGMIDETFMVPQSNAGFEKWWGNFKKYDYPGPTIGYGEWGIIDTWRRKKPEFWATKKAYSPAKILLKHIADFEPGQVLPIPVYNRFDHTDFKELKIQWTYNGETKDLSNIALPPHTKGHITIPANDWKKNTYLDIKFYKNDSMLIDAYHLRFGKKVHTPDYKKQSFQGKLSMVENTNEFSIVAKNFTLNFSKQSGYITAGIFSGDTLIYEGPTLNYKTRNGGGNFTVVNPIHEWSKNWHLISLSKSVKNDTAYVKLAGTYDSIQVKYEIKITADGDLITDYTIENPSEQVIRELGLTYNLSTSFNTLSWDRDSYWSVYPENHIGRPSGHVKIYYPGSIPTYRREPTNPWGSDVTSFYYNGIETNFSHPIGNIARAMKENVWYYSVKNDENRHSVMVIGQGKTACRISPGQADKLILVANNLWDYPNLGWGNYTKQIRINDGYKSRIHLKLE